MSRRLLLVVTVLVVAAPACAGDAGGGRPHAGAGGPTPPASLAITYDNGSGDVRRAGIACGDQGAKASGYLRLAYAADLCRKLAEVGDLLTSRPPRDRVCSQVYGGPQTAHFTGAFAGRRVDRSFGRRDGCEVSDWDHVRQFVPRPDGPLATRE